LRRPRLSFDDGPSESTPEILDLLRDHDVRAQFFVIGRRVRERPDVVARAFAEGHLIGNHSWDHARLAEIGDDAAVIENLAATNDEIAAITGRPPAYFRAPHASVDDRVRRLAGSIGLNHMGWDAETSDFSAPVTERIVSVLLGAGPGEIVLLHDGNGAVAAGPHGRPLTVAAVAQALPLLQQR
jgi:peptidoglycan-N-acetylglucosamine deacetylase